MAKVIQTKSWMRSKTVWFNIVTGAIAVAVALQGQNIGLPKGVLDVLAGVVTVGNIILRFMTNEPIK